MNSKTVKKIKKFARNYPLSLEEVRGSFLMDSDNAYKLGLIQQLPKTPRKVKIKVALQKINHLKKLKAYYKKYGAEDFINKYTTWLIANNKRIGHKYPSLHESPK